MKSIVGNGRFGAAGQEPATHRAGFDPESARTRIAEFAGQVERRLAGEITEDQFRPLRLANNVYLQRHAYMLRIPLAHGALNPRQLRMLAHVARAYDRGYDHLTTRGDIEFNWPALADIPAILASLATVGIHLIQTSPPGIRIVTADHLAGAAADEVADPRPYAEILRRWSSVRPEFSALPRRLRIAVTGSSSDLAGIGGYDIGLHLKRDGAGQLGFAVHVGSRGRAPAATATLRAFLPADDLVSYCTAVLRVHDLHRQHPGNDRARLETLVRQTGAEAFARQVETEWAGLKDGEPALPEADVRAIGSAFAPPALPARPDGKEAVKLARLDSRSFGEWLARDTVAHRHPDYAVVVIALDGMSGTPGAISAEQMETIADLAERYGFGDLRVSRERSLVLPHVARADLKAVHEALTATGLATAAQQDRENRAVDSRPHAGPQPIKEALHAREIRAA